MKKGVNIIHIILFIITASYILESIFIRGLFSNIILACVNILLSIVTFIITIVSKNYKLAIIDFILFGLTLSIFVYLTYL